MAKRCFVGVGLDAGVLERLDPWAARIRARAERDDWSVGWTPRANLHLTLQFLGVVDDDATGAISAALDAAMRDVREFDLRLARLGAFADRGRPRVLFVSVGEGEREITALAASVNSALGALGFAADTRRFHPHVTLGRVREAPQSVDVASLANAAGALDAGATRVRGIVLYQSKLSNGRPTYVVISEHSFGGQRP